MANFQVHHRCQQLHHRTNMFEIEATYLLEKLSDLKQSGFSPETTPMIQLQTDSARLRYLADQIDAQFAAITAKEAA